MALAIWKDYYVSLGAAASYGYRIKVNDTIIYQGKAFLRPGDTIVRVRINDICADYLHSTLPNLSQAEFSQMTLPVTFVVEKYLSAWEEADSVQFVNDYSYNPDYDVNTMGMAAPINGRLSLNQWAIWTGLDVSQVNAFVEFADGTSMTVIVPVAISADFNADFSNDFSKMARAAASGTAVFRMSQWGDVVAMTINGIRYQVVNDCNRYALYYVNSYGGWDSLLIEGNHSESDSLTRHTREMDYDNRNVSNRGRMNYVNQIEKTMTFHTSWLTDEQSSRMHHLLNSPNVYLYDILTDEMIPVLLTNSQTGYKTYKGNGGKLVNYSIDVTFANRRVRR